MNVLPCPFCGSTDIKYSVKKAPDRVDMDVSTGKLVVTHFIRFYIAMYCDNCHCYGRRILIDSDNKIKRMNLSNDPKYREFAEKAWNERTVL